MLSVNITKIITLTHTWVAGWPRARGQEAVTAGKPTGVRSQEGEDVT